MTTFVRRVSEKFDDAYWHAASRYMERELGAVSAEEAKRHEKPSGFTNTAGQTTGQRKDASYCFAPYDGLRGLGMSDVCQYESIGALPEGVKPENVNLDILLDPKKQEEAARAMRAMREGSKDAWKKALPYVAVGGVALVAIFALARK